MQTGTESLMKWGSILFVQHVIQVTKTGFQSHLPRLDRTDLSHAGQFQPSILNEARYSCKICTYSTFIAQYKWFLHTFCMSSFTNNLMLQFLAIHFFTIKAHPIVVQTM